MQSYLRLRLHQWAWKIAISSRMWWMNFEMEWTHTQGRDWSSNGNFKLSCVNEWWGSPEIQLWRHMRMREYQDRGWGFGEKGGSEQDSMEGVESEGGETESQQYRRYMKSGLDEVSDPELWQLHHWKQWWPVSTESLRSKTRQVWMNLAELKSSRIAGKCNLLRWGLRLELTRSWDLIHV